MAESAQAEAPAPPAAGQAGSKRRLEGLLTKMEKSALRGVKWRKKWVAADGDVLVYFASKKPTASARPAKIFFLDKCQIGPTSVAIRRKYDIRMEFTFMVEDRTRENYIAVFACDSSEELRRWLVFLTGGPQNDSRRNSKRSLEIEGRLDLLNASPDSLEFASTVFTLLADDNVRLPQRFYAALASHLLGRDVPDDVLQEFSNAIDPTGRGVVMHEDFVRWFHQTGGIKSILTDAQDDAVSIAASDIDASLPSESLSMQRATTTHRANTHARDSMRAHLQHQPHLSRASVAAAEARPMTSGALTPAGVPLRHSMSATPAAFRSEMGRSDGRDTEENADRAALQQAAVLQSDSKEPEPPLPAPPGSDLAGSQAQSHPQAQAQQDHHQKQQHDLVIADRPRPPTEPHPDDEASAAAAIRPGERPGGGIAHKDSLLVRRLKASADLDHDHTPWAMSTAQSIRGIAAEVSYNDGVGERTRAGPGTEAGERDAVGEGESQHWAQGQGVHEQRPQQQLHQEHQAFGPLTPAAPPSGEMVAQIVPCEGPADGDADFAVVAPGLGTWDITGVSVCGIAGIILQQDGDRVLARTGPCPEPLRDPRTGNVVLYVRGGEDTVVVFRDAFTLFPTVPFMARRRIEMGASPAKSGVVMTDFGHVRRGSDSYQVSLMFDRVGMSSIKHWHQRFLRLSHGSLHCGRGPNHPMTEVVSLRQVATVEVMPERYIGRPFVLRVRTTQGETFFQAPSTDDMLDWAATILQATFLAGGGAKCLVAAGAVVAASAPSTPRSAQPVASPRSGGYRLAGQPPRETPARTIRASGNRERLDAQGTVLHGSFATRSAALAGGFPAAESKDHGFRRHSSGGGAQGGVRMESFGFVPPSQQLSSHIGWNRTRAQTAGPGQQGPQQSPRFQTSRSSLSMGNRAASARGRVLTMSASSQQAHQLQQQHMLQQQYQNQFATPGATPSRPAGQPPLAHTQPHPQLHLLDEAVVQLLAKLRIPTGPESDIVRAFVDAEIDLPALLLLDEGDLKEMGLALGPRKKLVSAIRELRNKTTARSIVHRSMSVKNLNGDKAGSEARPTSGQSHDLGGARGSTNSSTIQKRHSGTTTDEASTPGVADSALSSGRTTTPPPSATTGADTLGPMPDRGKTLVVETANPRSSLLAEIAVREKGATKEHLLAELQDRQTRSSTTPMSGLSR